MLRVRIAGTGSYLPSRRVTNQELEERWDIPAGWIERATGVRERRYAAPGEISAPMAAGAARMALENAGLAASELDLIVGASATPQQAIPCTAAFVQQALGIAEYGAGCFDVNATCLSFLVALDLVVRLIATGASQRALIFSSELSSLFLDPREKESAVLFGDAAAAAVVTATGDEGESAFWHSRLRTDSRGVDLTRVRGGGSLHPPNDPATTPEMNTFSMNGPSVYRMASRAMPPFLDEFYGGMPWTKGETDAVVPHQASLPAIRQLAGTLGFRPEQVVINIAERGNCVGASIPLALAEALAEGRIQRGHRVLLLGTGAGLSIGAIGLTF